MFRVMGNKAIDLKRRDPQYAFEEEKVRTSKARNGVVAGGILLGFVASVLNTMGNIASGKK